MIGRGTRVFRVIESEEREHEYRPIDPCEHCGLAKTYALWERFYTRYSEVEFVVIASISISEFLLCDPEDYEKIVTNKELYDYYHLTKAHYGQLFMSVEAAQNHARCLNSQTLKGDWIRSDTFQDDD